jgi:hypothetical protein
VASFAMHAPPVAAPNHNMVRADADTPYLSPAAMSPPNVLHACVFSATAWHPRNVDAAAYCGMGGAGAPATGLG